MLATIDWLIIIAYLIISVLIGLYFKNKAEQNLESFFLGGRNLPWWLAGLSMVATTFAADTPLAVTELVGKNGISGNWLWWNMLIGGMLTTFFFARLWRRAQVLTELEFIYIRYGGKPAALLRKFKAAYLGLFVNTLIIAWVNLAMMSILEVFFDIQGLNLYLAVFGLMALAVLYSTLSGLWGVSVTDAVQFFLAMAGSVILAFLVIASPEIGGLSGLVEKLPPESLNFFPTVGTINEISPNVLLISFASFVAYGAIQWWASWYPGAEPGGGGYIAQRMMSTKNEKHAVWATLFFQVSHYALRPWPWILVALAAVVLYPDLPEQDLRLGYVYAMKAYLPVGLKGLVLAAFIAAYMSTISTQLNFGSSILTNDLFLAHTKNTDVKHQIRLARWSTILIMFLAFAVSPLINSITEVWAFLIECGAGLGLVLILRWFWWRINVWSEITATLAPFFAYALAKWAFGWVFPNSFFFTVGVTTLSWIGVTLLTKPENDLVLTAFYQRVKPKGVWGKFAAAKIQTNKSLIYQFISWLASILATYSALFATGAFLLQKNANAIHWLGVLVVSIMVLYFSMKKTTIFDDYRQE